MNYQELIEDLKNLVPTIVLDSLAKMYKHKIIPSHNDIIELREDVIDLSVYLSEMEELVNYNAELLNDEINSTTTQDNVVVDILNNHAELIEAQAKEIAELKAKLEKK